MCYAGQMKKTPDQLTLEELAKFGSAAAKEAVNNLRKHGIVPAGGEVELVGQSGNIGISASVNQTRKAS
jgi:hypothetical protein